MRYEMPRCRCVLLLVVAVLLRPSALSAEPARVLTGSVLDPDGKAVVNAAIVIRDEASDEMVTTTTDGSGRFAVAKLANGTYAVDVFVAGFEIIRRTRVPILEGTSA